jgi:hypothetical protein
MDWFKEKILESPYLMGKSMVSGFDFPLNQSIEHVIHAHSTVHQNFKCFLVLLLSNKGPVPLN